jgi:hypothetical protein
MCKSHALQLQKLVVSHQARQPTHLFLSKPSMRGASCLLNAPAKTLWSTQSEIKLRRHVCDSGTLHCWQYDPILHLLRHVFASDHATTVRTIALRWPTSNDNRRLQQHLQAPQQSARALHFTFFDTQPEEATSEVQPLWQWSHILVVSCVVHTCLPILRKASFKFLSSVDMCTIAPTHTLSNPVPSHRGQGLCAIANELLLHGVST